MGQVFKFNVKLKESASLILCMSVLYTQQDCWTDQPQTWHVTTP